MSTEDSTPAAKAAPKASPDLESAAAKAATAAHKEVRAKSQAKRAASQTKGAAKTAAKAAKTVMSAEADRAEAVADTAAHQAKRLNVRKLSGSFSNLGQGFLALAATTYAAYLAWVKFRDAYEAKDEIIHDNTIDGTAVEVND